jgi:hypothetical protein
MAGRPNDLMEGLTLGYHHQLSDKIDQKNLEKKNEKLFLVLPPNLNAL